MTRPNDSHGQVLKNTLLLQALAEAWRRLNQIHFKGAMRPPVFLLSDGACLGRWSRQARTLEISCDLAFSGPWARVEEVLLHEMAHQYVHEVLRVDDETAHGAAFRMIAKRIGLLADSREGAREDPILVKITRLLSLATSPNPHEARAAMDAAHRLMLKHNVQSLGNASSLGYESRQVGAALLRIEAAQKILAGLLASHFFVDAVWRSAFVPARGAWGRALELSGTRSNLDIAEYVHGYLTETSARLWMEARRQGRAGSAKERQRYLAGVMSGFAERLRQTTTSCASEGLVWVGDANLEDYVSKRHPHLRHSRVSVVGSLAWHNGRSDGQKIVLHRAVTEEAKDNGRLITER